MGAKPPRKGIDPLGAGDEKLKRRRGLDVCDADAKIGFFLMTACSTSRATNAESLDALDNTRTKLREFSIPVMISSP
jgi:hypothetical protein